MNKSDFMGRECNSHEEGSILYLICAAKGNAFKMNYQTDTQGCIIDVKYQYMGAMNMAIVTTKKYTSVIIRVCHSRSRFLSCMYIHDDFMTESR